MNDTPHRILVVDDEPSITEFVSYALKKEGFFTDVVDNGEDALALATKNSYDLFVLDIMLPGMDGYELCRRLRSKTTVPVLFLSTPSWTRWWAWKSAAMTTWRSPSACESSSHASAPCCAADRAATSPALTTPSPPAVSRLTRTPTRRRARTARSTSHRASSSCLPAS